MCVDGEMYGVLWSQLDPAKANAALEVLSAVAASDTVPQALRNLEAFLHDWGNASEDIAAEIPHLTHASHSIVDRIRSGLVAAKTAELDRRLVRIRAVEPSSLTAAIDLHEALLDTAQKLSAVDDEESQLS
jgi:hypothetical protein